MEVGKTFVAYTTAVRLADQGKKVLLIRTDPVSNPDEVPGSSLSLKPIAVTQVPKLFAMNNGTY